MPDNQLLDNGQGVIDPDTYFETNSPPPNLNEYDEKTSEFVKYHGARGTPVVLITVSRHTSLCLLCRVPCLRLITLKTGILEWLYYGSTRKPDCTIY